MTTDIRKKPNDANNVKSNFANFDFNIDWKNCLISDYKLALHNRDENFNILSYVGYDEDEWYKD